MQNRSEAEIRLGTMGYSYDDWLGNVYPPKLNGPERLAVYSQYFDIVELDTTFYGTPRPQSVQKWFNLTPSNFRFTAKTPRQITHEKHLVNAEDEWNEFYETITILKHKLEVILIQLPPDFSKDKEDNLKSFLKNLDVKVRIAVEFRHKTWFIDETASLLRDFNTAWTSVDFPPHPKRVELTADFAYFRLIGVHWMFAKHDKEQMDRDEELRWWADQINNIKSDVDTVYGFFNNDFSGHSPTSVNKLKKLLGLTPVEDFYGDQPTLF